jgi:hypothetical protein
MVYWKEDSVPNIVTKGKQYEVTKTSGEGYINGVPFFNVWIICDDGGRRNAGSECFELCPAVNSPPPSTAFFD